VYRRILVYLGDRTTGELAMAAAGRLAAAFGASLDLVDTVSADPRQVWATGDGSGRTQAAREREQLDRLARAADRLIDAQLDVTTHLLRGPLPEALLAHRAQGGHDLLLKAAQQGTTQDEAFAGALDDELMRQCPVPVWFARRSRLPLRVAAAVEVSPTEEQPDAIDLAALETTAMVARRLKADLHVVHAAPAPEPGAPPARPQLLNALLAAARVNLPADHLHRLVGRTTDVVPRWLSVGNVDLLVLGTACATPQEQAEGTAEALLRRAPGSVLTLRVERPEPKPRTALPVIHATTYPPRPAAEPAAHGGHGGGHGASHGGGHGGGHVASHGSHGDTHGGHAASPSHATPDSHAKHH